MKKLLVLAAVILGAMSFHPKHAGADEKADLRSVDENPPVITDGSGRFKADIRSDQIDFVLSYDGIATFVRQAHIHVENPSNNGPITVFLCTNLGNTPPGAQVRLCPQSPGTVEGTIFASDVIMAGNVPGGDLGAVAQILREGAAYINVHSDAHPGGEIRGQVSTRKR